MIYLPVFWRAHFQVVFLVNRMMHLSLGQLVNTLRISKAAIVVGVKQDGEKARVLASLWK
jgi:hypothetical protein